MVLTSRVKRTRDTKFLDTSFIGLVQITTSAVGSIATLKFHELWRWKARGVQAYFLMWLAKKESKSVAALSWWRRRSILRLKERTDNMRNFFSEIDRSGFISGWEPQGNWSEDEVGRVFEKVRRWQKFGISLSGRVSKGV